MLGGTKRTGSIWAAANRRRSRTRKKGNSKNQKGQRQGHSNLEGNPRPHGICVSVTATCSSSKVRGSQIQLRREEQQLQLLPDVDQHVVHALVEKENAI